MTRGWRVLKAASLCGCLLAGCAVGPQYHGPPAPEYKPPAVFKNAADAGRWKVGEPADTKPQGPWWNVFNDPVLTRYIEQALAGNQELRIAAARIAEARSLDRVAAADFYPNISLDPSATRNRTTNTGPIQRATLVGANPFAGAMGAGAGGAAGAAGAAASSPLILATQPLTTTYSLFRAPLDLSWELDLFGRVRRQHEAAREERQAMEADFRNMALSISANVASNYFALRDLDSEAIVLQRTIQTRQEALRIARERLQAGLTSDLDLTQATSDLASNQADVFALERTRSQVENALATLLGQPASVVRAPARPLPVDGAPPRIPPGLPAALLERRPDVASAERQLAAANARVGIATAAFFPVIRLTGAAGFESADIGSLFEWESRMWQLGPSVTLPIFEGGRNVGNLGAARARYDEAVGTYREQVLTAFQDVENALGDLRTLAGEAEARRRATEAALQALQLSQRQYERGSVNFLQVLDAERTALTDERTSTQLLGQRMQATVQLIKALGGDWR